MDPPSPTARCNSSFPGDSRDLPRDSRGSSMVPLSTVPPRHRSTQPCPAARPPPPRRCRAASASSSGAHGAGQRVPNSCPHLSVLPAMIFTDSLPDELEQVQTVEMKIQKL